jgi:ABC-type glycerol-3-phosphate transport system substrate-binding protein
MSRGNKNLLKKKMYKILKTWIAETTVKTAKIALKIGSLCLIALFTIALLSACGGSSSPNKEKTNSISTPSTSTDSKDAEKVTPTSTDSEDEAEAEEEKKEEKTSTSSKSSEDWDAILKSYDDYIEKYIKLMKKAKSGDISALSEYPSMLEKATDLSDKLKNAGSELSASQAAKFLKLQTKLANAALDL